MADSTSLTLQEAILKYQYNPIAMQQFVHQHLADITEGRYAVVDPSNPFAFLLDMSTYMTCAAMSKNEVNNRRQYARAAQTFEDLYRHMSDRDYIGRFATPSIGKFWFGFPLDELVAKMVLDPTTGIRKIVMPRNTTIKISDTVFSLQYPVEIRQMVHGGLSIVYDTGIPSPLQQLETNRIDWEVRQDSTGRWVFFQLPMQQFKIKTMTGKVSQAAELKLTVALEDQFYFARVYYQDASKNWVEMYTTHSDQIYDPTMPTAVLKKLESSLQVRIPQIYTKTNLMGTSVRIDTYQTKGVLEMVTSNYDIRAYTAEWLAIDAKDATVFTAPLNTFRELMIYSNDTVTGGKDGMSFDTQRKRVMANSTGGQVIPITNVQIESALEDHDYEIVKSIDTPTKRTYLATKEMPNPTNANLITAASAATRTLSVTLKDIVLLDSVIDNGEQITITPDTLFKITRGVVSFVPTVEVDNLLMLGVENRALAVNQGHYLYTPFHYVLDLSGNELEVRPYYLDSPEILTKLFGDQNASTMLDASVGSSYGIIKSDEGYVIQLRLESGADFKNLPDEEVFVQLAFVPQGEKDRAYMMGTLIGVDDATNERIYEFRLGSNFNVTKKDGLQLRPFFMYSTEPRLTDASLTTDFDVIVATTADVPLTYAPNGVDAALGKFLLPTNVRGISLQTLRVQFGKSLDRLWAKARSAIGIVPYKTWEVDVQDFYTRDIYKVLDEETGSTVIIQNGEAYTEILHHAGDPVLLDGQPTYRHRVGDPMLDEAGNPIPLSDRGMARYLDLMLIDGTYWFATDTASVAYRQQMVETLVEWLTEELEDLASILLQESAIFFYPRSTLGDVNVMYGAGQTTSIDAGQGFKLTLSVTDSVHRNTDLRDKLTRKAITTLDTSIRVQQVAMSDAVSALEKTFGDDVVGFEISNLGGERDLSTITLIDEGDRLSIRKRLTALPDGSLIVEEDVVVDFIRHQIDN